MCIYVSFSFRMQEKHVKVKQCEHQTNIIEMQEKLKKTQNQVQYFLWDRLYNYQYSKLKVEMQG